MFGLFYFFFKNIKKKVDADLFISRLEKILSEGRAFLNNLSEKQIEDMLTNWRDVHSYYQKIEDVLCSCLNVENEELRQTSKEELIRQINNRLSYTNRLDYLKKYYEMINFSGKPDENLGLESRVIAVYYLIAGFNTNHKRDEISYLLSALSGKSFAQIDSKVLTNINKMKGDTPINKDKDSIQELFRQTEIQIRSTLKRLLDDERNFNFNDQSK